MSFIMMRKCSSTLWFSLLFFFFFSSSVRYKVRLLVFSCILNLNFQLFLPTVLFFYQFFLWFSDPLKWVNIFLFFKYSPEFRQTWGYLRLCQYQSGYNLSGLYHRGLAAEWPATYQGPVRQWKGVSLLLEPSTAKVSPLAILSIG